MENYPIVGAWHHPPAQALFEVLPPSTLLILRPEPTNPFDPNAIQVLLPRTSLDALNPHAQGVLVRSLAGYGTSIDELHEQETTMLGYIARKFAEGLAPQLGGEDTRAKLVYGASGAPQASLDGSGEPDEAAA
jgi:hypothetical protein